MAECVCDECITAKQKYFAPLYASTQQQYPGRAVYRTILVNVITWIPLIAAALSFLATGEGRPRLPDAWEAWLAFAAAWAVVVSGWLTRIIAHPVVDAKLRKIGASSRPM